MKLSSSQLTKLKPGIKNGSEVTLSLSSNLNKNSNDESNCQHKLILTDTQFSRLSKAFPNSSSANIKFSKTKLSKLIRSRGIIADCSTFILQAMFLTGVQTLKKGVKRGVTLAKNAVPELAEKAT